MLLSDTIALLIEQMLDEGSGRAELRRNDLASQLGCVPSQINYVITSRFTPERGYMTESRRGGGGYIRIVRVPMGKNEYLMHFFHAIGGGLEENVIKELRDRGYNIRINGVSNYTVLRNPRVVFVGRIPDHTDDISSSKDIPSWKRMCYCILRNDHTCRFMGFGLTREQQRRIDILSKKYDKVGEKDGI